MGGCKMSKGLMVVIGMSFAYIFSFLGLIFAYISYKKKLKEKSQTDK